MKEVGGSSYLHERAVFRCGQRGTVFTGCRGTFRGEKIVLEQQFDLDVLLTLADLAANTLISVSSKIDASRLNGFRVTKTELNWELTGKTIAEGPILFGVAANFTNDVAIEVALEADVQSRVGNNLRGDGTFLKILGKVGLSPSAFPNNDMGVAPHYTISYGKNGWSIPEGQELVYWAYNAGAQLTTGTVFIIDAEHFGVWLRD